MKKQIEKSEQPWKDYRFEFVLYINNNIICQRLFNIDKYNPNVLKSLEIKELMDNIVGINNGEYGTMGIIPNFFKEKSIKYLFSRYNPYLTQVETDIVNRNTKDDMFQFEIKVDKRVVSSGEFPGYLFPTEVRYNVDIKPIIKNITNEIVYFFTKNKYQKYYDTIKL